MIKAIETIYLAGKMEDDDWRQKFFDKYDAPDGHAHQLGCNPLTVGHGSSWPDKSHVTVCGLAYTGPFFVDTCGGHGYSYVDEEAHGGNIAHPRWLKDDLEKKRSEVQRWCFRAIAQADLVFAWIDRIDCYGTIAEIGYAKAIGKLIWIAGPRRYEDFWFVYSMADETCFCNQGAYASPDEIFRNLLEWHLSSANSIKPFKMKW